MQIYAPLINCGALPQCTAQSAHVFIAPGRWIYYQLNKIFALIKSLVRQSIVGLRGFAVKMNYSRRGAYETEAGQRSDAASSAKPTTPRATTGCIHRTQRARVHRMCPLDDALRSLRCHD